MEVGVSGQDACVRTDHLDCLLFPPLPTEGKEIKAQCMPETQYHGIFPMAMSAMIPLRPSS